MKTFAEQAEKSSETKNNAKENRRMICCTPFVRGSRRKREIHKHKPTACDGVGQFSQKGPNPRKRPAKKQQYKISRRSTLPAIVKKNE